MVRHTPLVFARQLWRGHRRSHGVAPNGLRIGSSLAWWRTGSLRGARGPRKRFPVRGRFERLESRELLSVTSLSEQLFVPLSIGDFPRTASDAPSAVQFWWTGFASDGDHLSTTVRVEFTGQPQVATLGGGVMVALAGTDLWLATGEPVLPVASVVLALPQGTELAAVELSSLGAGEIIASGSAPVLAPNPVPFDGQQTEMDWSQVLERSLTSSEIVRFTNHTWGGYRLASLAVTPVLYDHTTQTLAFYRQLEFRLELAPAEEDLAVNPTVGDQIATVVANPEVLTSYSYPAPLSASGSDRYEYVVITNAALAREFEPLIQDKIAQGLTAKIVTTEWIAANYSGTESGDLPDRIRQFLQDSYRSHGTQWVLLGGDVEVVPARGVYAAVGDLVDTRLPTDMYYASLDGPWNGDGDDLWGEPTDGVGGHDIDLVPEIYVGRAPVSNITEARNFVAKTLQYSNNAHPNAKTALLLGEKLDSITQGSVSNEIIRQQTIPGDWRVITLYDTDSQAWTTTQVIAQLNASPNLVHHLGHSNANYVARMTTPQVATLSNAFPYVMYSQGCDTGSFDTRDLAIAEQHVVAPRAAVAVVMNSRYGWYVPGNRPGGNHDYALAFFDSVFNEHKVRLGEALMDSKLDNLFRLAAGGAYRWIHFTSTLFGDPHLAVQTGDWVPPQRGTITGVVFEDENGNGQLDAEESPQPGQIVYLDLDDDGRRDSGSVTFKQDSPVSIPDYGTIISQIEVSGIGQVHNLTVSINVSHTYTGDLRITLVSPSGKRVMLVSNAGGSGDDFRDTVFDDSAAKSILEGAAPFAGSFRPQDSLGLLRGERADGLWTLEITDTMPWDAGKLNGWSLTFTYDEPYVVTDIHGTYALTGLPAGTYVVRHELASPNPGLWLGDPGVVVSVGPGQTVANAHIAVPPLASPPVDLGRVDYVTLSSTNSGNTVYRLVPKRTGLLTVLIAAGGNPDSASVVLYDTNGRPIAQSLFSGSSNRRDWFVEADREYFLGLRGVRGDVTLFNLVSFARDGIGVYGTPNDDEISVLFAESLVVSINGVNYEFGPQGSEADLPIRLSIGGDSGIDTFSVRLPDGELSLSAVPNNVMIVGTRLTLAAVGVENIRATAGRGDTVAELTDGPGNDTFESRPGLARLSGPGYQITVENFATVHAYSRSGGEDVAQMYDSPGDDRLIGRPHQTVLAGLGFYHRAKGFRYVHAYSKNGGNDTAQLYGSSGDDFLRATSDWASLRGDLYFVRAKFFSTVQVWGNGGKDIAQLVGSDNSDTLEAAARRADFRTPRTAVMVQNFFQITVDARGGWDSARLSDSPTDDRLRTWERQAILVGSGYELRLNNFEELYARSQYGGIDTAELWDSPGDDRFTSSPAVSVMEGAGYRNTVTGFAIVHGYAVHGGRNTALLAGGDTVTSWNVRQEQVTAVSETTYRRAKAFDTVFIEGGAAGSDQARVYDSPSDDRVEVSGDRMTMLSPNREFRLKGIPRLSIVGTTGKNVIVANAVDLVLALLGNWT